MLDRLAGEILSKNLLSKFKPMDISNVLWAFATANHDHPSLFKAASEAIIHRQLLNKYFQAQEEATKIWL